MHIKALGGLVESQKGKYPSINLLVIMILFGLKNNIEQKQKELWVRKYFGKQEEWCWNCINNENIRKT